MRYVAALSFAVVTVAVGCTQPVGEEETSAKESAMTRPATSVVGTGSWLNQIPNADDCEVAGGVWTGIDQEGDGVIDLYYCAEGTPGSQGDGSTTWESTGNEANADAALKTTAFLQRVVTALDKCATGVRPNEIARRIDATVARANANRAYVEAAKRLASGGRLLATDFAFINASKQMSAVQAAVKRASGC